MAKKLTLREAIFSVVENYPEVGFEEMVGALAELGHIVSDDSTARGIYGEAKFHITKAIARHRDLIADHKKFTISSLQPVKNRITFGVLGDTHFCSRHHDQEWLEDCVEWMLANKCKHIFHGGDMIEGFGVYAGQINDLTHVTEDDQINEAVKLLPRLGRGRQYYGISGNHDLAWIKHGGHDPLISFAAQREDFEYLGKYAAVIQLNDILDYEIIHPRLKPTASLSRAMQMLIDNKDPERRPRIMSVHHWHADYSINYRGVYGFACPSFQGHNELSIRSGWPNKVGANIVHIDLDANGNIGEFILRRHVKNENAFEELEVLEVL